MLDIGWSELLIIGVVALIVVGPKDLPHMFRALGRMTGKVRSMAREFSSAMEDAARDSGLDEATKSLNDIRNVTSKRSLGVDALDRAAERFEKWDPKIPSARAGAKPDPAAKELTPQEGVTPASADAPPVPPLESAPDDSGPQPGETTGQRRLHAIRRSEAKDL
ncbi:Sec-independent protein translocase protein TatB [Paracoccus aerodenitrificans]|uniref:Sec-independent protein translocase protein TatB n=1 Tax=Paracoccus aerodenitrificans TaxID=3017781 RepID=UPI0022F0D7F4|nr:Sec-independent protein translocase protein TatB [Paracoccus aerodenitrificans]WBU64173.1 Sec-independent protein translocase protein TatB [Paracoccus aerodenitrificans]